MDTYFKDHITNILNNLKIPFHYKSDRNLFYVVLTKENISDTLAVWHRDNINSVIFYCPVETELSMRECKKISVDLLNENEELLYGNLGIADSAKNGKYLVSFQHSFIYERGKGFLVTEEEIKEFLSYASFILPKIHEKLNELLSKKDEVLLSKKADV